ncbi:hypothetical protein GCM10010381_27100 [Streptomyces xantholiticus]|nr:hypothetical protein GCM10010381_27100 [Streptomyces xantholiticus]
MAPWIPVTVVPTSSATVAIETFMTELSSAIRNWPAASVGRTSRAVAELSTAPAPDAMRKSSQPPRRADPRPAKEFNRLADEAMEPLGRAWSSGEKGAS